MCVCVCVLCVCVCACVCAHAHPHMLLFVYVCVCVHAYPQMCVYVNAYMSPCVYVYNVISSSCTGILLRMSLYSMCSNCQNVCDFLFIEYSRQMFKMVIQLNCTSKFKTWKDSYHIYIWNMMHTREEKNTKTDRKFGGVLTN